LYVAFFFSIVNFGEPTLSLGVPNMDMNPCIFSNPHVNDIDNENIDNDDIDIDNENINSFLSIERNILDNVPSTISMR